MGHGWVIPNPDGSKARCGGPALCPVCAREALPGQGPTPDAPITDEELVQWAQDDPYNSILQRRRMPRLIADLQATRSALMDTQKSLVDALAERDRARRDAEQAMADVGAYKRQSDAGWDEARRLSNLRRMHPDGTLRAL